MRHAKAFRIGFAGILAMILLATMIISPMAATYTKTDSRTFKTSVTNINAGTYEIRDTYYSNSRCLYIRDEVTYTPNVLVAPYNYSIYGFCTFTYVDLTNQGAGEYREIANKASYTYTVGFQAPSNKTVTKVEVWHYFNSFNHVSNCSTEVMHTTFVVE